MKIYTYRSQPPNNEEPWCLGEACEKAYEDKKCGDYIDRGLILLKELEARGYGVVQLLCPHGLPLAENICGPCSKGRATSPTSEKP